MATQRIRGFCALCRSRCGCISVVEDGKLVAVEPDPGHPTGQSLCVKGRAAPELVYAADRLLHPLRRTRPKGDADPGWVRISWEEALDWTADRMREAAARGGSEAVAFGVTTPSGTAVSDGFGWIERLIRLFGSPNTIWGEELCAWHRDYGTAYTFGVDIGVPDFARTECLVLWGHNPSVSFLAQATAAAEAEARGAALIVVDPRRAGLANRADQWLRVRPGTDGALALGLAGVMIAEGWYDRDFIRDWSTGPFLVRDDTGRFLTPADLGPAGSLAGYVAWDRVAARPVGYDPKAARYESPIQDAMLSGSASCATPAGPVTCRPAFERYAALCRAYSPDRVEQITGVPAAQIVETARLLWQRRPVSYFHWTGLEQHSNATQSVRAISLLYALTGSFDVPGGNLRVSRPAVNDLGGRGLVSEAERTKVLGFAERPLGPGRHGWVTARDVYRAILQGTPYPVRGLIGFGGNTLLSQPDAELGRAALAKLDFLVVADLFMTPTAELADVVLPVASAWEREGLRAGFGPTLEGETHIQLRAPVVAPRGESRSDTWIACELAKRLGLGGEFFGGDEDAGHCFVLAPSGVTLEELRANPGGVRVPLETRYRKYAEPGTGFATPSGRVEIYAQRFLDHGQAPLPEYVEPAASPVSRPDLAARYPLVLTSTKVVQFCHSQHRNLPQLRRHSPDPVVELSPEAAGPRGIRQDDWVTVETPRATMRARARLNRSLATDVVCAQFGWWQACEPLGLPGYDVAGPRSSNYNDLIDTGVADPISGTVPLRSYLCEVRRTEGIALLEVRDIHTYYGDSYVLQGVSLRVEKSQVVGILGRNGMGKTTLIRSIVGFTPPRTGQVIFKERDITGWPSNRAVALGMGLVPQGRRMFGSLTVAENLSVAARGNGGPWTMETVMDLFPRLRERAASRAGKLSGGEQQMLAIGRALMTNPDLLLMDEPTEGLAPLLVREVGRVIGDLKARGLSILLVEQNIPLALRVTDEVHVVSRGRIVHSCAPHALWENQEIKARYLGL